MIDAHFHVWRLSRGDYGWLTPAQGVIHRDVTLDDWRAVSAPCGVTAGILVQAAPTEAETIFLLRQAADAADVLCVVGWVDLLAPDAPQRIRALAKWRKLKGLRPMLHDIPDPDWILHDALGPALQAMVEHSLVFDALVRPAHLPRIASLAARFPGLRIVIDHGAKPDIANQQWRDWALDLDQLAQCPQVACKLSGLWTEAAPGADASVLARYVQHLIGCFGPSRILWGSDWPVIERAADYARWHRAAHDMVASPQQRDVFGATARNVYRI